jgi:hypothetical protein
MSQRYYKLAGGKAPKKKKSPHKRKCIYGTDERHILRATSVDSRGDEWDEEIEVKYCPECGGKLHKR